MIALSDAASPPIAWSQFGGTASHGNVVAEKNTVTVPRIRWHVADASGQPSIGHGAVYSGGKRLFRIEANSGKVLSSWRPESGDEFAVVGTPAIASDQIVVVLRDGGVASLRPDLLATVWSRPPSSNGPEHALHSGALQGTTFVYALGARVIAIDIRSGTEQWSRRVGIGAGTMTPAVHDQRVFIGTEKGTMLALALADGKVLWSRRGQAGFGWSSPSVAFGRVFIADRGIDRRRSGALNAFDEATGKRLWQTVFHATGFSMPGVRDHLLVGGFGRSVAYFDPDSGKMSPVPRIRTGRNAFGSPTFVGDALYFGNLDGNLYAHDAQSGRLLWRFNLPSGPQVEGNVYRFRGKAQVHDFVYSQGSLYVSTTRGLFALEQDPDKETASLGYVLRASN